MIRKLLWSAYTRSRGLLENLAESQRFTELSEEEARHDLGSRLLAQLMYFGKRSDAFPEWRMAARTLDVDRLWEIWPQLPVVTKHDFQTRFRARQVREQQQVTGVISATGGSTGEPVSYLHDRPMLIASAANRFFVRKQMGWRPGMPTICVWGSERDIGGKKTFRNRISGWLRNDWIVDGYRMTHRTTETVLAHLTRHRVAAMYGFTSMLEYVARSVLERDLRFEGRVASAWNGGEMLFPSQQELFQRAFGVPLRNVYGSREFGPMAYQRDASCGLEVLRPWIFIEVVDDDHKPLPPGQTGKLLVTSTVCRGTPFLRYEIGDLGCSDPIDHDVSGMRTIRQLNGRSAGLLELPSGDTVNCLFWNHLFKEIPEIHQFQVVVRPQQELFIRLKGTRWSPSREADVRKILRKLLGPMRVGMDWVDEIPRTRQGKLIQVVRED